MTGESCLNERDRLRRGALACLAVVLVLGGGSSSRADDTTTSTPTTTDTPRSSPAFAPVGELVVSVEVFSGRPNPTFTLSPTEQAELLQAVDQLSPLENGPPSADGLGFIGFSAADDSSNQVLTVRRTYVGLQADERSEYLHDPNGSALALLTRLAAESIEDPQIQELLLTNPEA